MYFHQCVSGFSKGGVDPHFVVIGASSEHPWSIPARCSASHGAHYLDYGKEQSIRYGRVGSSCISLHRFAPNCKSSRHSVCDLCCFPTAVSNAVCIPRSLPLRFLLSKAKDGRAVPTAEQKNAGSAERYDPAAFDRKGVPEKDYRLKKMLYGAKTGTTMKR